MSKTVICKSKEKYMKLFEENESLYSSISDLKSIEVNSFVFDNRTNLGDFEWYKLEDFSSKEFATKEIKENYSSVDYDMATQADAAGIEYIFEISEHTMFFQKVTKNAFIKKRNFITLGKSFRKCNNMSLFQINTYPDAIYDRAKDILYFRRLFAITKIFNGINEMLLVSSGLHYSYLNQYLLNCRLYAAKQMLINTNLSVKEIAQENSSYILEPVFRFGSLRLNFIPFSFYHTERTQNTAK